MYTDMTTFTIQSDKVVSNEVNDMYALLEPAYRTIWMNILASLMFLS